MAEESEIRDALSEHASCIGKLCMAWATLEHFISDLLMFVARWNDTPHLRGMIACFDTRDMITAIKTGLDESRMDKELASLITGSLDYIDNVLRPARNRAIHDIWWASGERDVAVRYTKTGKPQKSNALSGMVGMIYGSYHLVSLAELELLISDVRRQSHYLLTMPSYCYQQEKNGMQGPPPGPRARRFLLHQQERQSQKGNAVSTQQRQPRSSAASRRKMALAKKDDAP